MVFQWDNFVSSPILPLRLAHGPCILTTTSFYSIDLFYALTSSKFDFFWNIGILRCGTSLLGWVSFHLGLGLNEVSKEIFYSGGWRGLEGVMRRMGWG